MAKRLPTLLIEKELKPLHIGQSYKAFLYYNGFCKYNRDDKTYMIEMYASPNHRINVTSEGAARFRNMSKGFFYMEQLNINDSESATLLPDTNRLFQIYEI